MKKTMTETLDKMLQDIKKTQDQIEVLEVQKASQRERLLAKLKEEEIKTYKNDFASVSYVERKTIKIADRDAVIGHLLNNGLKNFLDLIPEVPEHYDLNKDFDDRVKKGHLEIDGVEVLITELPQIKF